MMASPPPNDPGVAPDDPTLLPNGMRLKPHQIAVRDRMLKLAEGGCGARKGLIVAHAMGCGKTVSALASARALFAAGHIRRVVIAVPKTVLEYWHSKVRELGLDREAGLEVEVGTHHKGLVAAATGLAQDPESAKQTLLIVDEAHNMRTYIDLEALAAKKRERKAGRGTEEEGIEGEGEEDAEEAEGGGRSGTPKALAMIEASRAARLVMLLTGTPVVNGAGDLANMLACINGVDIGQARRELPTGLTGKRTARPEARELAAWASGWPRYLRRAFSVCEAGDGPGPRPGFPAVVERCEALVMPPDFRAWYQEIEADAAPLSSASSSTRNMAFINGIRRAVNGDADKAEAMFGPKLRRVAEMLDSLGGQIILYSTWCDHGVNLVRKLLEDRGVPHAVVMGDRGAAQRSAAVADFNAGRIRVLLFTAAGSEGMDLKATSHVIILDPHWNPARIEQAVARAVRFGSHEHLPAERRVVTVHHLVMMKVPDVPGGVKKRKDQSADEMLRAMTAEKGTWVRTCFVPFARAASIEGAAAGPAPKPKPSPADFEDSAGPATSARPAPKPLPPPPPPRAPPRRPATAPRGGLGVRPPIRKPPGSARAALFGFGFGGRRSPAFAPQRLGAYMPTGSRPAAPAPAPAPARAPRVPAKPAGKTPRERLEELFKAMQQQGKAPM
jgi:superfamily II DNA or RNA helicase